MLLQLLEEMLTLIGGLLVAYLVYILIARRDDKPTTDPPTMAHTALRDIVERAVEEARKLPGLGGSGETRTTQEGRNIAEHSYEDLLATAILNKVIEKYQRERVDGNSNVLHEKPTSAAKCTPSESELGLDEGVEEGCSSLEPLSQDECSDCSASCLRHLRNRPEPLSLTIEERIEEVTTTYTSDEEHRGNDVLPIRNAHRVPFPELGMDIIDPSQESSEDSQDEPDTPTPHVDLVSPIESWEENWLFQKKKVQKQADPVAMLVPNPSADFKALIGDKDAEDTSDLSECSSAQSDEEIEKELMEAINNVVPRSPKKTEFDIECNLNGEPINGSRSATELSINENGEDKEATKECNRALHNGSHEEEANQENRSLNRDGAATVEEESTNGKNKCGYRDDKEGMIKMPENESKSRGTGHDNRVSPGQCSLSLNGESETKEVRAESDTRSVGNKSSAEDEAPVSDAKNTGSEKVQLEPKELVAGVESQTSSAESKKIAEDTSEADTVLQSVTRVKKEQEAVENSLLISDGAVQSPATEEPIISEVPKTPACTPTRTSFTEDSFESMNNVESIVTDDENVLDSLERAKKKLMVASDDEPGKFAEEEANASTHQKVDFHAEDAQQESEYTEHYDIATQRHLDSLTKTDINLVENETVNNEVKGDDLTPKNEPSTCQEVAVLVKAVPASCHPTENKKSEEEAQLATPPRPGTIAEREHKKWENAPPIENNPYSEESIQKRLWERQYSRRLSDIPGIHTELPKSNGADMEVVLTPNEPDIARFGRDYYINNSKAASGERVRRSASSRPSSSLSQRSNSTTCADHEPQEVSQCRESDPSVDRSQEVGPKVAKWQKNNVETSYGATERASDKYARKNDVSLSNQKSWEDKRVEEILENERKNSKNEINAKLNNQENNYDSSGILEAKKTYSEENQKKIRRIDLKAYGFENEFGVNAGKTIRSTPQRVVNKLDLKSFGYDGGLRRSQSNNHLESTMNESDFKPRIIRVTNKSNLARHGEYRRTSDCHSLVEAPDSDDSNFTQSTDALDKLHEESYGFYGALKSAKSVPNIAKCGYYSSSSNDQEDEEVESYVSQNSSTDGNGLPPVQNDRVVKATKNNESDKLNVKNGDPLNGELKSHGEKTLEKNKLLAHNEKGDVLEGRVPINKKLPLPSVRRLAEAFSKQPETVSAPMPKATRTNGAGKDRSSTPEIHIVETPRQMHSLTARSLSKKFREGLRQIPNKVTSPPASHVTMEQPRVPDSQTDVVQSKGGLNDTDVISPGKLKSNIIFWEQMQRRS